MKKLLASSALLVLLITGSASAAGQVLTEEVDPGITSGEAAREFKEARDIWLASGISGYRMKVSRSCFCAQPSGSAVKVRNGRAVKVARKRWTGPKTVPEMFRIVGDAIKKRVAVLDVEYHDRYGFPKSVSIDYIGMAVDDEISYRISGFRRQADTLAPRQG